MTEHHISAPTRRHALALSVTAAVALALAGCSRSGTTAAAGTAIEGTVKLFDATAAHQLAITWKEADYKAMIAAYESDSSKDWMSASLTIDGTLIDQVGIRLKGNSTLRSLGGTQQQGVQGPGGMGGTPPSGAPQGGGTPPTGAPQGGGGPGYGGGVGGVAFADSANISADDPASLPLLIRFDKFVKGRTYQGLTQLALRPGSPVLNEALALSLTAATGQPTQRYSYTTYSVNGSKTQTRLLLENPDEAYADAILDGTSVLYKADADSSFTYQGDDKATYEEQFKQLNKTKSQDVTPVIKFLKWLQDADSATFDAKLADWVDVASLAKYLATSNLLANSDDMAGPGQNYYLSYDVSGKKLSVISWDLNLALINNATASPDSSVSMGGGKGGNALKSRFLASSVFGKVYDDAYGKLFAQMYSTGKALTLLTAIAAAIPVSDGLSKATLETSTATVRTFVEKRTTAVKEALAKK